MPLRLQFLRTFRIEKLICIVIKFIATISLYINKAINELNFAL